MRYKKSKALIFLITFSLVIGGSSFIFSYNNDWSSQAISDFLSNKVESPSVLKDEKYHQNITREEFAELVVSLYAVASKIDKNAVQLEQNPFKDTDSIDVQRAYSLGIIQGTSKDEFSPNENITREQIATMITRFLNAKGITTASKNDLNSFTDKKNISSWAFNSLAYCVDEGVIQGFDVLGEKQLQPKGTATVEQVITMLDRIAIRYNWIIQSKDKYINGFLIPNDVEFYYYKTVSNGKGGMTIIIEWDEVKDIEKLKLQLNYTLSSNINNNEKVNSLIQALESANSQSININNQVIETNEYTLKYKHDKKYSSSIINIYPK
ncbi:S-layer homology domain-containing protein [Tepidibacter formicigenes]|uniref:S-layer homology domain-containing protein n=1 Tax=Tepidibacter formicigenes DSM 15518 TaxID=1123349 RepID=A0A1M6U254_9FIRM|nr:S-layer homology domain-containing protein [Tepidibacter formicigenes]SHK63158.1 S-layer homology domain-containing protein [Tepidibacter formicigenes DSM 15518]